jgi:imidazolonepropionase-like amidohydrolase
MCALIRVLRLYWLLVALTACAAASAVALPSDVLVVHNGTVIDGTGAPPIADGLVAIKDGLIVAVGPEKRFQVPDDARTLDARRGSILPGFIDAHTHILNLADTSVDLSVWLRSGVTTMRDLGSRYGTGDTSRSIAAIKRRLTEAGNTIPTIVFAGPIVTAVGGYPVLSGGRTYSLEVADISQAQQSASRLLEDGADGIKIAVQSGMPLRPMPMLTSEQILAIVHTAQARGKWVSAHVTDPIDTAIAVKSGVSDLAHAPIGRMTDLTVQQMIQHDILLVTTLSAGGNSRQASLVQFLAAGGKVAMGSDITSPRTRPGMPMPELQDMVDAGMTPMQVVVAATKNAAHACGIAHRVGTLEVGKQADVIVASGDPLQNIQAMENVRIVIKRGEVVVER